MSNTASRGGRKSRASTLSPSISEPEVKNVETVQVAESETEKDLFSLLENYGYLWNRGIYIGEGDSALLMYVKASILGHKVYIEIDDYNSIRPNAKDLSITQMMRLKKEVVSDPIYMDDCANADVSGTVYECSGGFCTLKRDFDSLEVVEEDFYIKAERQASIGFEKDPSQGKPIVKLSEIKENNTIVVQSIIKASKRLAANAEKDFYLYKINLGVAIDDLKEKYKCLYSKIDATFFKLTKEVHSADVSCSDIMIPPEEAEKPEYFNQTKFLEATHSNKRRFFKEMSYLGVITNEIDRLSTELDSIMEDINNRYW